MRRLRRYRGRVTDGAGTGVGPLALAWGLALVAGGRGVLALLPVGDAGLRRAFGGVETLAPSAVAGVALVRIAGGSDGLAPLDATGSAVLALAVLAWLVGAALGPAGLVPRHPRLERALPRPVVALSGLGASALLVIGAFASTNAALALLAAASFEGGLARLGAAPLARRAFALALCGGLLWSAALVPGLGLLAPTLALAAGAHGAGFVRRADRRDLWLAMLAATAAGFEAGVWLGALPLALVATCAPRPRLALVPTVVALVGLGLHTLFGDRDALDAGRLPDWCGALLGAALVVWARAAGRERA